MVNITTIQLPLSLVIGIACILVCLFVLYIRILFFWKKKRVKGISTPSWYVPSIENHVPRNSFFHIWDLRVKIISLVLFCFCSAALQHLQVCCLALLLTLPVIQFSGISWQRAGKRLAAISAFLFMLLLILPLNAPQQENDVQFILLSHPLIIFSLQGLLVALTLFVKACIIALVTSVLFWTAPLSDTLAAFHRLGVPSSLCQIIVLAYRYIFLFVQEARRMYRSMQIRGFAAGTNKQTFRVLGNFFGMLFVRSFERTQQVYEAMLSRGYKGTLPCRAQFILRPVDIAFGVVWVLVSLSLLLFDQFIQF